MADSREVLLDVILPCYNPQEGWEKIVTEKTVALSSKLSDVSIHLIVVNDGSTCNVTDQQLREIQSGIGDIPLTTLANDINRGKGFTLRKGTAAAKGKFQIYTDIDFPYQIESMVSVFNVLRNENADVVAGVRDTSYYINVPPVRKFISKMLRALLRGILRMKITDTQAGLKGFSSTGKDIFLKTRINRFLFDLEFIFLASNEKDAVVKACPVHLRPDIQFSRMNFKILLRESFNFIGIFFRVLGRRLFGRRK